MLVTPLRMMVVAVSVWLAVLMAVGGAHAAEEEKALLICAAGQGCDSLGVTPVEARIILDVQSADDALARYRKRFGSAATIQTRAKTQNLANRIKRCADGLGCEHTGLTRREALALSSLTATADKARRQRFERRPQPNPERDRFDTLATPGAAHKQPDAQGNGEANTTARADSGPSTAPPLVPVASPAATPVKLVIPEARFPDKVLTKRLPLDRRIMIRRAGEDIERANVASAWWRPDGQASVWLITPSESGTYEVLFGFNHQRQHATLVAVLEISPNHDIRLLAPAEVPVCSMFNALVHTPGHHGQVHFATLDGKPLLRTFRDLEKRSVKIQAPDVEPGAYLLRVSIKHNGNGALVPLTERTITLVPGSCGRNTQVVAEKALEERRLAGDGASLVVAESVERGTMLPIDIVDASGQYEIMLERRREERWSFVQRAALPEDGLELMALWPPGSYRLTLVERFGGLIAQRAQLEDRTLTVRPARGDINEQALGKDIAFRLAEDAVTNTHLVYAIDGPESRLEVRWTNAGDISAVPPCKRFSLDEHSFGRARTMRMPPKPGHHIVGVYHPDLGEDRPLKTCSVLVHFPFDVDERRAALRVTVPERIVAGDGFHIGLTPSDTRYRVRDASGAPKGDVPVINPQRLPEEKILATAERLEHVHIREAGPHTLRVEHDALPGMTLAQIPVHVEEDRARERLVRELVWGKFPQEATPGSAIAVPLSAFSRDIRLRLSKDSLVGGAGGKTVPSANGKGPVAFANTPLRPGRYTLRLTDRKTGDVLDEASVTLRFGGATMPDVDVDELEVRACEPIRVRWSGPEHPRWFLAVVYPALLHRAYDKIPIGKAGNPAVLSAPPRPGVYEVRLYRDNGFVVVGMPITVRPASDRGLCEKQ